MEELLIQISRAIITAYKTDKALRVAGYDNTPYFDIYGCLLDGLYDWAGEHTDTIEQSDVYLIIHTVSLTDDRRAALLMGTYEKNHPAQK